ncbi:MAG: hypothetical protein LBI37_01250 [Puniceicoccales bacterium]|jgi:UDP-N-acetylglucosamine acyltransferase|nr:hypothetical protein [Puniceicoccales bacterium]
MSKIHPSAIVSDSVILGEDVSIGPYSIIGEGVKLGKGTTVGSHCLVHRCAIGNNCIIDSFSALGGLPQITNFKISDAGIVTIGKGPSDQNWNSQSIHGPFPCHP